MWQYIVRRIAVSFFVLIGVSMLIYGLIRTSPADYVSTITNSIPEVTPAMRENLEKLYGLDKGIAEGYLDWMGGVVQGDLGVSFIYKKPVGEV
ncbi:MAG: diguanylate cyclase, partial [Cellulosilyticaceae bacterium]